MKISQRLPHPSRATAILFGETAIVVGDKKIDQEICGYRIPQGRKGTGTRSVTRPLHEGIPRRDRVTGSIYRSSHGRNVHVYGVGSRFLMVASVPGTRGRKPPDLDDRIPAVGAGYAMQDGERGIGRTINARVGRAAESAEKARRRRRRAGASRR
jgi:hypothetical protein